MTPEQEAMLKSSHDSIKSIEQLLKGYNGTKGMCADYADHKKDDMKFRREFYRFRSWVYIMIAFAAGGGGAVGAGLSKWFGG